jgi:hypothetical protein
MADAEADARTDAGHDAGTDARFGGLTPSEAAQKRWAEERAREAAADDDDADAIPTDGEIIAALRRKAERGDAAAARELREWRAVEPQALHGDAWMEVLDPPRAPDHPADHRACPPAGRDIPLPSAEPRRGA